MKKGTRQYKLVLRRSALVAMTLMLSDFGYSQEKTTVPNGTDGLTLTIPADDSLKKLPANEFNGRYSTLKVGVGYVLDYATYSGDDVFNRQLDSAGVKQDANFETRDFRIMFSGALKTKRTITWKFAYMYDGENKAWLIRETGVIIGVPELSGHLFIGRTKEGFSMEKVMNGHSIFAQERPMALDVIPILADGIKWFGYLPKPRVFWNLGVYNDFISKGHGFSTYSWQGSARVGWLPLYHKEKNEVIHLGANLRYGQPLDGQIAVKSRPESNPLPLVINTGKFNADYSTHLGGEAFYSNGSFLVGSEVVMHSFHGDNSENHNFFGGSAMVSYLFTGGKRPYNTVGSIFGFVKVNKSVFKGGWGEWEAVLRISSLDLNDGPIQGGKFLRLTPMVNWYMSRILRMEFVYGYGILERYNMEGTVNMFQTRLQLTIL